MNNSELLKFADDYLANNAAESGSDELIRQLSSALRTLASQEKQEPVAWGRVIGGRAITISRERTPANDTPLYAAPQKPPPAAGWDQAIEAAMAIAKDMRDKYSSPTGDQYTQGLWDQSQRIIGKIKALRATPAATKPADAGGGVRVKPLEWNDTPSETSWVADTSIGRYFVHHYPDANVFISFLEGRPDSKSCGVATLDAAKAAAQADYEQRIRSALDQPLAAPITEQEDVAIQAWWPDPTPEMLDNDALFDAIWETIKSWDVNVSAVYSGYCGASGNHARAIYDAVKPLAVDSNASVEAKNALYWAVGRWNAEVLNRPLQNIHRRSLDDTWRQVIRHFGGDDRELCGPTHDDLVDSSQNPHVSDCARDVDPIEQHLTDAFTVGRRR